MAGDVVGTGLVDKLISAVMYLINYMLSSLATILGWFGLSFTPSEKSILTLILAVIILAVLLDYFIKLFGKWILNSIAGLAALLILHYLFGVTIPLTFFTLAVVALFGVPGLLAIIVLHIGGVL